MVIIEFLGGGIMAKRNKGVIARYENRCGLLVVVPVFVYFLIFSLVPVIMLFWYAFRNYRIIWNVNEFVGFGNFALIFSNPDYYNSMLITLIMAMGIMAAGVIGGFFLALGMNAVSKGKGLYRTLWYIPALLPSAASSALFNMMLRPDGNLNDILGVFGAEPIIWQNYTGWMYFFIILIITWKGLGNTALLFIAGLNSVSKDIYEASELDGCVGLQRVFRITLPLIRPMLGFILITGFMGALNVFEPVLFISGGGPDGTTKVILYQIYDEAFVNDNHGLASALSVIVLFFAFILTFISMKITDDSMLKFEEKREQKAEVQA